MELIKAKMIFEKYLSPFIGQLSPENAGIGQCEI